MGLFSRKQKPSPDPGPASHAPRFAGNPDAADQVQDPMAAYQAGAGMPAGQDLSALGLGGATGIGIGEAMRMARVGRKIQKDAMAVMKELGQPQTQEEAVEYQRRMMEVMRKHGMDTGGIAQPPGDTGSGGPASGEPT